MASKIKVQHEGKEIEIQLPDGVLTAAEVAETHMPKAEFQAELKRRVDSVTAKLKNPDDLVNDEDFIKKLATDKKDVFMKLLNITPPKTNEDIAKLQSEAAERVRKEELAPVQNQLKMANEEVELLRYRTLDAEVVESSAGRIPTDLMDLVKLFVRGKSAWDPERKGWFIKKEDGTEGFEYSANPQKGGHPFMGTKEYLEKLEKGGAHKSWFTVPTQEGVDFKGGGRTGALTLEQFQKLSPADQTKLHQENPSQFNEFMSQIQTAGENRLFGGFQPPALAGTK